MPAEDEWPVHQHDRVRTPHPQNGHLPTEDWDQTGGVDRTREEYWELVLPFGNLVVQVRRGAYLLFLAKLMQQILILGSLPHVAS